MENKMNKLEELIKSITVNESMDMGYNDVCYPDEIKHIMKEYAEFYARKCLKIAEYESQGFMGNATTSPTQIDLPEHE